MLLITLKGNGQAQAATTSQPTTRALPILFIIGDSTVKNHGNIQGWGDPIADYFDHKKIVVENDAAAGRSSRTFISEGRWEAVRAKLQQGDFVMMQFGHNDTKAPISAMRYSLAGLGDETEESVDPKTKEKIVIHTYGWYMRKMITESLAAGAEPIVLSSVPRCKWAQGKIVRGEEDHCKWAGQAAQAARVPFIPLNDLIADRYDPAGQARIKALYFPQDNTHTNPAGARINAACVILGLLQNKDCLLNDDLIDSAATDALCKSQIDMTTKIVPATRPSTKTSQ
jgi:lysophospholipase L1-like esterase